MKLNYKKITVLFLCFHFLLIPAFSKVNENEQSLRGLKGFETQTLDASKNARHHCNIGNIYFEEKNYIAALKEYEIAYNLNPKSRFAATYLYNIARCYMMVKNYDLAQNAIEGAIKKDCINMTYYSALADCYIKRGVSESELYNHLKDTQNPYNKIIAGYILLKTGRKNLAETLFDNFINDYPKMMITQDVKILLNQL